MELSNKTAVVTGAGNGIGRAIALALANQGTHIAAVDIEHSNAQATARAAQGCGVKAVAYGLDVSQADGMEQLAADTWTEFGSVELLFNNAGVMSAPGPTWALSAEDAQWVFGVNVFGMLNGIRAFVPRWIAEETQAWLVNTGSEHSLGLPHGMACGYNASKHAVMSISDNLRNEVPEHIGVSLFCPGIVESTLWKASERRPQALGGAKPANPAGGAAMQFGLSAEEVANKVVEGVREEHYFILTHPHAATYAEHRAREIADAFAKQAPRFEGDEQYDVGNIIKKLQEGA